MSTEPGAQNLPEVNKSSLTVFGNHLPEISNLVKNKLLIDLGPASKTVLAAKPDTLEQTISYFGELMLAVYELNIPRALAHEYASLSYTLGKRGWDDSFFTKFLDAWIIAINSSINPPASQELTVYLTWLLGYLPHLAAASCPVFDPLVEEQQTFLQFLLERNKPKAQEHLLALVNPKRPPLAVIQQVLIPTMCRVGLLWQEGTLNVADEHAATNICRYLIYRMMDLIPQQRKRELNAFLCCVPGEEHDLAIETLAGLLERRGWRISFIGHNTPQNDLLIAIAAEKPTVIFVSVTLVMNLPAAKRMLTKLRQQMPGTGIVLGGFGGQFARESFPEVDLLTNDIGAGLEFSQRLERKHA